MPSSLRPLRKKNPAPKIAKKVPTKWRAAESDGSSKTKRREKPPALKPSRKRGAGGYRCKFRECRYEISKAFNLALHLEKMHVDSKCDKCDERFVGTSKLARHMNKEHKEYELPKFSFCGFCGKELTTDYLVTHSLRFHDLTPCLDCGDWFEGLNLLEHHLQKCEKGAKRDLCDHLLAKYDGKVKLPSSDEGTTVIKRETVVGPRPPADNTSSNLGRFPIVRREAKDRKSNKAITVDYTPIVKVAAHFVSQPVPSQRIVELVGDAQLNDTATLAAISDIGLEAPFGTDDCFDETETFDPFLNLDLGNFIEEVFSKPPDKTDVAREYAVPDVEQLPPLLPSLEPSNLGPPLSSGSQFSLDEQADLGSDGSLNTVAQEVVVDMTCEFDTQPFRLVPSNDY